MYQFFRILPDMILCAGIYIALYQHWSKESQTVLIRRSFLFFAVLLVVFSTLTPFLYSLSHLPSSVERRYNPIPFIDWYYGWGHYVLETVGNILLFVPFGFAVRYAKKASLSSTVLQGAFLSCTVEFIQPLISAARVCDCTDLVTNTAGALLGALLFEILLRRREH